MFKMDFPLKAAFVGIVLNVVLSHVGDMMPRTGVTVVDELSNMARHHKRTLFSSSLVVALSVYLAVVLAKKM